MRESKNSWVGVLVLTFLIIFGWSSCKKVEALEVETAEQIEENETETSKWFDREIVGEVIHYAITVIGVISGVCVFIKHIKNIKTAFEKKTENSEKAIADMKEEFQKAVEDMNGFKAIILANNESTVKRIEDSNKATNEKLDKVIEVDKLVYTNNTGLVRTGVATKIAEVLEDETNDQA